MPAADAQQRVLVTGAGGQLGGYLRRSLGGRTIFGIGSTDQPGVDAVVDIRDADAVMDVVAAWRPDVVLHGAAWTDVDGAERDPAGAQAVNVDGSRNVALAAKSVSARVIAVSSDFVFSGTKGSAYVESDRTDPVSVYGTTKRDAEIALMDVGGDVLIARTAWLYGGAGKHFPRTVLTVLRDRGGIEVVDDEFGSPTFAGDLAEALVQLLDADVSGVVHMANAGRTSRFDLAREVAGAAGFPGEMVRPVSTEAFLAKYPLPARRPADSELANIRGAQVGVSMRPWENAVHAYVPGLVQELGLKSLANQGA